MGEASEQVCAHGACQSLRSPLRRLGEQRRGLATLNGMIKDLGNRTAGCLWISRAPRRPTGNSRTHGPCCPRRVTVDIPQVGGGTTTPRPARRSPPAMQALDG